MIVRHDIAQTRAAEFSTCRRYRYRLRYSLTGTSVLGPPASPVVFLMLNPSTADEYWSDPTVRRCMGFARAWGHSDLLVANVFALRATDPAELLRADDPVGPENDDVLASLPDCPIVAAWGSHKAARARVPRVLELIKRPLLCLRRLGKSGAPSHPLYLPGHLVPQPWSPP